MRISGPYSTGAVVQSAANSDGILGGGAKLGKLLARLLGQIAAQANDAGIVLVKHLVPLQPRPHTGQDLTILLEHRPVARLEIGSVQETPHIALPPADLADAP